MMAGVTPSPLQGTTSLVYVPKGAELRRNVASRSWSAVLAAAILCMGAGEQKTTKVGGRTYAFPPGAFMGGVVETGAVGDVLMEFAWPEMRPLTREEGAAWPRRDTIRVLANSGAPVAGASVPEEQLEGSVAHMAAVAAAPSGSLQDEIAKRPFTFHLASGTQDGSQPVPGGGMVQVVTEAQPRGSHTRDVFVGEPITRPAAFIECIRPDRDIVDPSCSHTFVFSNLIVKASYRQKLVPQWRDIDAQLQAWFKQHEVHP